MNRRMPGLVPWAALAVVLLLPIGWAAWPLAYRVRVEHPEFALQLARRIAPREVVRVVIVMYEQDAPVVALSRPADSQDIDRIWRSVRCIRVVGRPARRVGDSWGKLVATTGDGRGGNHLGLLRCPQVARLVRAPAVRRPRGHRAGYPQAEGPAGRYGRPSEAAAVVALAA